MSHSLPRTTLPLFILIFLSLACPGLLPAQAAGPIRLAVDAREAPRKIFHARLVIPASSGPLTLVYPKWIPGEHGPTGPIADLAGLKFTADGKTIPWKRDRVDMYAFHVEVPAGASEIEVALDYLSPSEGGRFAAGATATAQMAVINWNTVLLYPQGRPAEEWTYTATLRLPADWKFGTPLAGAKEAQGTIEFAPVSLVTLVDSPVIAGKYFRTLNLLPSETPPHYIDIAADSSEALEVNPELMTAYNNLVAETGALFGARHYRDYHFLYSLSDNVAHFGLEHHESSDDRVPERSLIDADRRKLAAGLLPHEMVHSWNGKYRRPADLTTPDYQQPMQGSLLWVYEGLTQYLGALLTARSGLWTPESYRENLALVAATLDQKPGRTWRPLADTAVAAQILYGGRPDWAAWRRGTDFYDESLLIWLEADSIIRRETQGRRSMDDFCRLFHGGPSGPPALKTYTFDDVVATMNQVAPYDWRNFFTQRLNSTAPHAPLGGLEGTGWRLVSTDVIPDFLRARERAGKYVDASFSIGISVKDEEHTDDHGVIMDAVPGFPADQAGIGPGMKLVAVNGREWSKDTLRAAIRATKSGAPLNLLVKNGYFFRTYQLKYQGGEKYPHLERDPGKPDVLSEILAPKRK